MTEDLQEAIKWFRKSAEQGNASAERTLGEAYFYGIGVPVDQTQGAMWYRKAAEQGNQDAEYSLGSAYYYGSGVPKDPVEGLAWLYLSNAAGGSHQAICDVAEQGLPAEDVRKARARSREIQAKITDSQPGKRKL